jgi:hypothetical protein
MAGVLRAEPVALDDLPVGEVGAIPEEKPEQIPATEKVAGIHPALPPRSPGAFGGVEGSQYITLFPTEEAADTHTQGGMGALFRNAMQQLEKAAGGVEPGPPCFVVAQEWHMRGGKEQRWPVSFEEHPSVHGVIKGTPAAQQYPNVGIRAVRREKLEAKGERADLSAVEAWLDPGSLGVRVIGKSTMPLARVAEGPGHVDVYAAKSKSGSTIHFVVALPRHKGRAAMHIGRHTQIFSGDMTGHSDCGHARLSLQARPGLGEQAMLRVEVVVSEPEPAPAPEEGEAAMGERPIREMRIRNLAVHLAVSRSASDSAVVPTVSFGWIGRERRQEVY